ncbi:c-type cytochrome [Deinococcus cellulosilyticus]|uniref:Cytochrome c family protein n=1 Tax=Deinococcus cellulosilyticus (strain DSM 18568 / NBRC 106333 / KACC 11606 / 5516J-15) TaxID=1223518 RepID=A0A511N8N5_DEIC1|nr:cytochrome c [Deinococcus cellulosilyticus]GEM48848.1 cytochrome c family protein [Deinococcus cellulosilyticus NBRC 106333 = KACC 11606]
MIYLILALAALMLAVVLLPTSRKAVTSTEDTQRSDLLEERDLLVSELRDLSTQSLPEAERERAELTFKARLARVLRALDELPPAPSGVTLSRPAHLPALLVTLLCASLLIGGGFTFFQSWRYMGVGDAEAKQLQNVLKLPELQSKASRSQNPEDIRAYARAAFDAGKFRESAQAYGDLINLTRDTKDAEALRRLGVFMSTNEKFRAQGLGLVQLSVQLEPKEPEGYLLLGYTYVNNGAPQEALDAFLKFRDLRPMSLEADEQIAQLRSALGQNASGEELFAQNCSSCHGTQGEGKTAPSLLSSAAIRDEAALRNIIQNGVGSMPAFPELKGKTLDALVQYTQSLQK